MWQRVVRIWLWGCRHWGPTSTSPQQRSWETCRTSDTKSKWMCLSLYCMSATWNFLFSSLKRYGHCMVFSSKWVSTLLWKVWRRKNVCTWYTGCPRRNVPDFGRVFLVLKYTDITQNTYVQSWTVTEIMAREKCGLLAGRRTVPVSWQPNLCYFVECGIIWRLFSSH